MSPTGGLELNKQLFLSVLQLNDLPEHTIIDLTDFVVDQIEKHPDNKGRSLQLLVKLLDQVSKMDIIAQQHTTVSGQDHKNGVIKKILESDWHVPVTSIITMFKDITVNQDQLKGIIDRISKYLSHTSYSYVAAIYKQLSRKYKCKIYLKLFINSFCCPLKYG